jgi:octaprenyl-diphosphate synthase
VFQLAKAGDLTTTPGEYEQVIRAKTATLFEAAAEVGAVAGSADAIGRQALRDYGLELGLAFQLIDDVLDYRGERGTLGKNTGDDLREGKMTLPVILALEEANPGEREIISNTLGRADASDTALSQIVAIFDRHRSLDRTIEKARHHVHRAREALKVLPPSDMRTLLSDIAEFYISRAH